MFSTSTKIWIGLCMHLVGTHSDSSDSSSDEPEFTWCTEDANVASWGIDIGTTILEGVDTLEFYSVGDFGAIGCDRDDCIDELANEMASALADYADKAENNGKFILNVGDNFYQNGISFYTEYKNLTGNDGLAKRWYDSFEELFNYDSLKEMWFYSTLGNHDWDPNEDDAHDQGLNESEWDIGTRNQIEYTSDVNFVQGNQNTKRWCMPSYYYTFSYELRPDSSSSSSSGKSGSSDKSSSSGKSSSSSSSSGKSKSSSSSDEDDNIKIRFVVVDGVSILPYGDKGCLPRESDGRVRDFCKGPNIPLISDQFAWLEPLLQQSNQEDDYTFILTHYSVVGGGKYGVKTNGTRDFGNGEEELDEKCYTRGYFGGFDIYSNNITQLMVDYNVQLVVSGHEHNIELFEGSYNNGKMVQLITGTGGKNDGIKCATQDDIDSQYNDKEGAVVDWDLLYVEDVSVQGFGHIIVDKDGITTKLIDTDLNVVSTSCVEKVRD